MTLNLLQKTEVLMTAAVLHRPILKPVTPHVQADVFSIINNRKAGTCLGSSWEELAGASQKHPWYHFYSGPPLSSSDILVITCYVTRDPSTSTGEKQFRILTDPVEVKCCCNIQITKLRRVEAASRSISFKPALILSRVSVTLDEGLDWWIDLLDIH
jgi:hypothetical protein